jgi:hypothetical protein
MYMVYLIRSQIATMPSFDLPTWSALLALIESDDEAGIGARVAELQSSGVLEWSHPDDELARTPVMLAYWYDHLGAANALVRAGADYQARDTNGRNVTWYAQNFGKGLTERAMSTWISVGRRRLSMEAAIRATRRSDSDPPPAKKRPRSGV